MAHQVVWEKCRIALEGDDSVILKRGEYVPDGVDDYQLSALTSVGALKFVDVTPPAGSEQVRQEENPSPAGNASREAWAAYALSKGASEEELKDPADGGLSRDELRELYGN